MQNCRRGGMLLVVKLCPRKSLLEVVMLLMLGFEVFRAISGLQNFL